MDFDPTYRLVLLSDPQVVGRTAASQELAKLVPGDLVNHRDQRLGLERTDWVDDYGKPKVRRSVIVEAEPLPGQWEIGV